MRLGSALQYGFDGSVFSGHVRKVVEAAVVVKRSGIFAFVDSLWAHDKNLRLEQKCSLNRTLGRGLNAAVLGGKSDSVVRWLGRVLPFQGPFRAKKCSCDRVPQAVGLDVEFGHLLVELYRKLYRELVSNLLWPTASSQRSEHQHNPS